MGTKEILRVKMKVAIQGLGEVAASVEFVLEREHPDIAYILCADGQLKHIAFRAGYARSNEQVIAGAAKRSGTKVVYERCDISDPRSIMDAVRKVMRQIKKGGTVVVNYGAAPQR